MANFTVSTDYELFEKTFTTKNGINVFSMNNIFYDELLNSFNGSVLSVNSITLQPYESENYDYNNRISQILQPISFSRINTDGNKSSFVLNPIVDVNQNTTNLQHINLGEKVDKYILDGETSINYRLLPYATVIFIIKYTQLKNSDFENKELVNKAIQLNDYRNSKEQYLSGVAKEYVLSKKDEIIILKERTENKKFRTIIDMLLNRNL
jgi:hypothetical protein